MSRFSQLLKQLSASARPLSLRYLREVASNSRILVARDDLCVPPQIVGLAVLVPILKPTRREARIEDVVVDERWRGHGIGRELTRILLSQAQSEGFSYVELTSSPHRSAANALYESIGFERRETNVYRYEF